MNATLNNKPLENVSSAVFDNGSRVSECYVALRQKMSSYNDYENKNTTISAYLHFC